MNKSAVIALLLAGCAASPSAIVAHKTTVFGLSVDTYASGQAPTIRLGLIRQFSQSVPVSTNPIYAPPYASTTDADIRATRQTVFEQFSAGTFSGSVSNFVTVRRTNAIPVK